MDDWLLSLLGGVSLATVAGAVGGVVSVTLSKYWFPKELQERKYALDHKFESHKFELKRRELLLSEQIEAARAVLELFHWIRPEYAHPDMDFEDACEDIAERLDEIEERIEAFLTEHALFVSEAVRKLLEDSRNKAAENKFIEAYSIDELATAKPSAEAIAASREIFESIGHARKAMIEQWKT